MRRIISTAIILSLASLSLSAGNIRFASRPSLSPDGKQIYFSYDGDIYSVPAAGGLATAIVNLGGVEDCPMVSPDGKYLAFSSDIQGNSDIYVVPVAGGPAVQLTYHSAADTPASWSADSKYIFFESARSGSRKTTWKVAADGGTPELMFSGYFNTVVNLVENPKTGEYYFNESMESISFPTRKRYVGDHNPNIKSWNPKSSKYTELTDYIGKDTWPMVDKAGNLYYVSDEYNKESNIVKYVKGGKPQQLTTFDKSVQYPKISADGSAIVYIKDYEIGILNTASGAVSVPEISVAGGSVEVRRSFADQKPSAAAVSPDGKKFALVIRGQLFVSDAKCKYLQRLATPDDERVVDVEWSKDNRTLYYSRTNRGWINLYKIAADNSGAESAIYQPEDNIMSLSISHKNDKLAFIDGSHSVMVCDLGSDSVSKVADAEFWSFEGYGINWSFDDSVIAFEAMNMFEPDIYIYSFKDSSLRNLTNSASTEGSAVFTPDGKYMYLLANPTSSSFPKGTRTSLYKLPLRKFDTAFKSAEYDKLFTDEPKKDDKKAEKKTEKKDSTIVIDYNDIFRRMTKVEAAGDASQSSPYMFSAKGKSYLFYSSFGNGGAKVWCLEVSDPEAKPKEVKDLAGRGTFFCSKTDLYALSNGTIYKINPDNLSAAKTAVSASIEKTLSDEFNQMFYETWGVLEQNYYDVKFHGADWRGVRDYYASMLPYVRTRANLRTLIGDMLGELNSSHLGFTSTGSEEKTETSVQTLETGIVYSAKNPYKVERIIADSPADKVEIDLKKGDELVAVDGVRVDSKANREKYFATPRKLDELKLTFSRGGKEFDVKVHTSNYTALRSLSYREWEEERKAMVEKKTDGKVAYIHMRAMGSEDLDDFLMNMHTYAVHKDALILDLRYNNGGNVHKEVIDFLRGEEHFRWAYRDFPTTTHPNVAPAGKPIVVLVNEHSLSDAEVTSNGIKTLGIAKLVGTETYRWIIFTSAVRLIDGSSCRMPAWGCYNVDGVDLENIGVKPDIYVRNTFKDRLDGADPQLDAAIKEILSEMK